jgi:hypothetical protein
MHRGKGSGERPPASGCVTATGSVAEMCPYSTIQAAHAALLSIIWSDSRAKAAGGLVTLAVPGAWPAGLAGHRDSRRLDATGSQPDA